MARKDIHKDGKKTQFSSTNQPDNPGRPKKLYTVLKEMGYGKDDIRTAMFELAWYDKASIKELIADESKPAIILVIARAFEKAIAKGDYSAIKEIIDQTIGRAEQSSKVDVTTQGDKIDTISWLDRLWSHRKRKNLRNNV